LQFFLFWVRGRDYQVRRPNISRKRRSIEETARMFLPIAGSAILRSPEPAWLSEFLRILGYHERKVLFGVEAIASSVFNLVLGDMLFFWVACFLG